MRFCHASGYIPVKLLEEFPPFYTNLNKMNSAPKLTYDISKSQEHKCPLPLQLINIKHACDTYIHSKAPDPVRAGAFLKKTAGIDILHSIVKNFLIIQ